MDRKELMKSILQSYINQDVEKAKEDFHTYLTMKSKEVAGIGTAPASTVEPSTSPVSVEQVDPATDPDQTAAANNTAE